MRPRLSHAVAASWPVRGGLAVVDQAIFAGSNFALNIYLARTLMPAEYGVFAFAVAAVLALFGVYSAVQLEPASVLGPSTYNDRRRGYLRAQMRIHLGLTGVLAMLLVGTGLVIGASTGGHVGRTFVAAGIACPLILLYHLVRRLLYVDNPGARAVAGSAIYACTLASGLIVAHRNGWLGAPAAFVAQALASGLASAYMGWRLHVRTAGAIESACEMRTLLLEQWHYGKYLVAIVLLQSAAVHGVTFMTTAMLGFGAVGILRAMQTFVLPFGHTMIALFAVAQPALARDFGSGRLDALRRKGAIVTATIIGMASAGEVLLIMFHGPLERLVFDGKFAAYSGLIPVFGLAIIFEGIAGTQALMLRAVLRPRLHMLSVAATAPLALVIGFVLIRSWDIQGAAATNAATWGVAAVTTYAVSRRWLRLSPAPILSKPGVTSSSA
jgi:O-antigen/teichoic acid export membrane protein